MQGIEIPIGAPLGQLDKDLKGAESKLKSFASEASKSAGVLGGSVVKGSNQAAFALSNLGRVVQDAPFGFISIQNNLNPLLESFQRLRAESTSNVGALKALGQSLIGPAGIGLAFSVVSAAILFYQKYQQKANKETKAAVDFNKELADSILTISQVEQEGRKNAAKDLSNLQTLYNATQNVTISQKERLKIADELIKQNPEYLKGFSAEEVIAGKAATAYQKLTSAILAKGLAEAGAANRQKLINQQLEQNVELAKAQEALTTARAKVTSKGQALPGLAAAFESSQISKNFTQASDAVTKLNNDIKNTEKQIALVDSVVTDLINKNGGNILFDPEKPKDLNKNLKSVSDILKELDIDFKQINASVDITFGEAKKEKIKALAKAIDDLIASGIKGDNPIVKRLQNQILEIGPSEFKPALTILGNQIKQTVGKAVGEGTVQNVDIKGKLIKPFNNWADYVNNTLLPKIRTNFETFFNDILMRGKLSFQSLGKAILSTLASVLASEAALGITNLFRVSTGQDATDASRTRGLGVALSSLFASKAIAGGTAAGAGLTAGTAVAAGGTAAVAGSALAGGAAAGAAGGAAAGAGTTAAVAGTAATGGLLLPILGGIAAGALIASLIKKRPKQVPIPPQFASAISTSAAASSQDFGGGRVVFEISGANLVGVLNRAGAQLRRYGP